MAAYKLRTVTLMGTRMNNQFPACFSLWKIVAILWIATTQAMTLYPVGPHLTQLYTQGVTLANYSASQS